MSEQQQSPIKIPLAESVSFEKGQEVDELISISLDPDVSITEEEEFILLNGQIELSGEYKRNKEINEVEGDEGEETRADEAEKFTRIFPVDITIPRSKIQHMEDVYIEIESFDYDLPGNSVLNIEAEVSVYGLYGDHNETVIQNDDSQLSQALLEEIEREEKQLDEEHAVEVEVQTSEQPSGGFEEEREEEDNTFVPFSATAHTHEEKDGANRPQAQTPQLNPFPFPELDDLKMEEVAHRLKGLFQKVNTESSSHHAQDSPDIFNMESESSHLEVEDLPDDSSDYAQEKEAKAKKKKKEKYKTISFADFFSRNEQENAAKMKICLVQQGDSVDRLADKYNISAQQLLRANQLEPNADLYEGQVLYIPEKQMLRK